MAHAVLTKYSRATADHSNEMPQHTQWGAA